MKNNVNVKASYFIVVGFVINIYDFDFGIDDTVFAGVNDERFKEYKLYYNELDGHYFKILGMMMYLKDFRGLIMNNVYVADLCKEFDLDILKKDSNNLANDIFYEGKKLYIVHDSYFDNYENGPVVLADAIDVDGNLYKVIWDVVNPDVEDGGDACNWEAYTVEKI